MGNKDEDLKKAQKDAEEDLELGGKDAAKVKGGQAGHFQVDIDGLAKKKETV